MKTLNSSNLSFSGLSLGSLSIVSELELYLTFVNSGT